MSIRGRNAMVIRMGLDPSDYNAGLSKMSSSTELFSKRVQKALGNVDFSSALQSSHGRPSDVMSNEMTMLSAKIDHLKSIKDRISSSTEGVDLSTPLSVQINEELKALEGFNKEADRIREKIARASDKENNSNILSSLTRDYTAVNKASIETAANLQRLQSIADAIGSQNIEFASTEGLADLDQSIKALVTDYNRLQKALLDSGKSAKRANSPTKSLGQLLRSIGSHVPGIRKTSDHIRNLGTSSRASNLDIGRMVRSLRNVALVSFGFRIAGAALGRLRSIVSGYISENETLQAQVNGLKAGMGQALAPAINLVVNAMSTLLPYVLGVSNAIGQLMGALFGEGWTAAANGAKKTAAATGSAAKAQKELNRQLMSFDEINKLNDNSSNDSGGGGSAADNSITPISSKMPAWMERFKTSFSNLFNSDEFKAANIGGKIGMALQTGLDWLGNEGKSFDWRGVGTRLRENFDSFMSSGWVDSGARLAGILVSGFADAVIGFFSPEWEALKKRFKEGGLLGAAAYAASLIGGIPGKLAEAVWDHIFSPFFGGISEYLREKGHNSAADFFDGLSEGSNTVGQTMGENIANTLLSSIGIKWPTVRTNIKSYLNLLAEGFRRSGNESAAGFIQGLADKFEKNKKAIKDEFTDPVVDTVNTEFGIHSPSTVFAGIASLCMTGYGNGLSDGIPGVLDKLNDLKEKIFSVSDKIRDAFSFEWHMPTLKLPHLNVEWDPVDNVLANFFGVTAFPRLSVSWFAKGGILSGAQIFGRMGSSLLGGGEYGREAVLPLDHNTGWMDTLAQRVVSMLSGQTGGDMNLTIPVTLDGKEITRIVIKGLREYARANGGLAF